MVFFYFLQLVALRCISWNSFSFFFAGYLCVGMRVASKNGGKSNSLLVYSSKLPASSLNNVISLRLSNLIVGEKRYQLNFSKRPTACIEI